METFLILSLLIVLKAHQTFGGQSDPMMDTTTVHVQITAGRTAILPCMVRTITSKYKVVWMGPSKRAISYGDNLVTSDRRYSVQRPFSADWNLQISRVRYTDSGKYMCQINTKPAQKKEVYLQVQGPPRISSSSDTHLLELTLLQIYCNVSGSPTPTLEWYKDNELLRGMTNESFRIENATRQDSGVYRCKASNGVSSPVTEDITVNIHYRPEISVYLNRLGQIRHKDTLFECSVTMNPYGQFYWKKDGLELTSSWKYRYSFYQENETTNIMSLSITSLQEEDFGKYVCHGQNIVGHDEASTFLYEYKPITKPPTTTVAEQTSSPKTTPLAPITEPPPPLIKTTTTPFRPSFTDGLVSTTGPDTTNNGKNTELNTDNTVIIVTEKNVDNGTSTLYLQDTCLLSIICIIHLLSMLRGKS